MSDDGLSIDPDSVIALATAHAGVTIDCFQIAGDLTINALRPDLGGLAAHEIPIHPWMASMEGVIHAIQQTATELARAAGELQRQAEDASGADAGSMDVFTPWVDRLNTASDAAGALPGVIRNMGTIESVSGYTRAGGTVVAPYSRYAAGTATEFRAAFGSANRLSQISTVSSRVSGTVSVASGLLEGYSEWQASAGLATGERALRTTFAGTTEAVVSYASMQVGMQAGAMIGTAIGGPAGTIIGAAAGFAIGYGINWAAHKVDLAGTMADLGSFVWDAGGAVVEFVGDVGGAVVDAGGAVVDAGGELLDGGANLVGSGLSTVGGWLR